jgi:hypothetical protein
MKYSLVLLVVLITFAVHAQSTNSTVTATNSVATNAVSSETLQSLEAQLDHNFQGTLTLNQPKPNEIVKGKFVLSGIAVEAVKKRNPLQLINPAAPAEYGSPDDNLVREPPNGRPGGLKIFAIRF